MIETEAQVVRCEGDLAWVKIRPHSPCGACDPEKGCKSVAITRLFGAAQDSYQVRNDVHAVAGDLVKVAVNDGVVLNTALWAYGLPLLLVLLGAMLGSVLAAAQHKELASLLGAVLGFVSGFVILRWRQRHFNAMSPSIVATVPIGTRSAGCSSRR